MKVKGMKGEERDNRLSRGGNEGKSVMKEMGGGEEDKESVKRDSKRGKRAMRRGLKWA